MQRSPGTLILIRHMRTEPAAASGSDVNDPSISEVGREEAARLGDGLRTRQIARVYSSDLKRARQTAQIIAESLSVPLELRSQLRELLSVTPEAQRASEQIVADAIDDITSRHADSSIAVVAHSGTIRAIARHLLQLPSGTYHVPSLGNGGLLVFRKDTAGAWTSVG